MSRVSSGCRHPIVIIMILVTFLMGCSSEPEETNLLIPLGFSSLPPNLVNIPSDTTNIEIQIKGPARFVKLASHEDLSYLVDLYFDLALDPAGNATNIEPGTYSIPVVEERIPLHPSLSITNITPAFIKVHLEKKMAKRLFVHVPYKGEPAPGYNALDATADPVVVEVTGAESAIEDLTLIQTKTVDITNARESFKKNLPLDLDPSIGVDTPIVMATIPIVETIVTQSFKDLPVITKNSPENTMIIPQTMEIKIKGPMNILKKSGIRKQFSIYIDLEGLGPGVYVRRAIIKLPVGLILADTRPELFTITIK